jgi:hypothetical protein
MIDFCVTLFAIVVYDDEKLLALDEKRQTAASTEASSRAP